MLYEEMSELLANDGEPAPEDYIPKAVLAKIRKFLRDLSELTYESGVQIYCPGACTLQLTDGDDEWDVEFDGGLDFFGPEEGGYEPNMDGLAGGD